MEGRMDGWADEWTDGWTDGLTHACTDGEMEGRMDGWMDGWTDHEAVSHDLCVAQTDEVGKERKEISKSKGTGGSERGNRKAKGARESEEGGKWRGKARGRVKNRMGNGSHVKERYIGRPVHTSGRSPVSSSSLRCRSAWSVYLLTLAATSGQY
eukprot:202718-Chlamydomonas_euryale.AAC.3